ncbi:MAG: cobalamin B12-binding domain-containing protein [Planctomycetota bacterium]|jgi:methanogenic corrinoid protein MtbC1
MMAANNVLGRYLTALLDGDRKGARCVIEEALQSGIPANSVYADIIWPIMEEIELLMRSGRIAPVQEHLATRINRTIADQLQNKLPRRPDKNKKLVVCCAPNELVELGAQIMADLFESDGWQVRFVGGGLTNDDILGYTNDSAPDILLIYGTGPKQAPDVRRLIDRVREVDAWPNMRIMVAGGLFNRAEGLWEHIGADLYAENAIKALQVAAESKAEDAGANYRTLRRARKRREKTAVT